MAARSIAYSTMVCPFFRVRFAARVFEVEGFIWPRLFRANSVCYGEHFLCRQGSRMFPRFRTLFSPDPLSIMMRPCNRRSAPTAS